MEPEIGHSNSKLSSPWVYFALVYLFSWAFTIPSALSGRNLVETPLLLVAYALAGIGPPLVAILLSYRTQDRESRSDFWRRIIDFRRIGLKWYGVIFLLVPATTALAALLDRLLGGQGLELKLAGRLIDQPLLILPSMLFYLLFGPLPEEIGWRGYALDRLQARRSALAASLILGAAWWLWHLPQFFIQGTYQYGLGFGSLAFWLFMLGILKDSILYTWIYNNTGRSTLSAILFHFMVNFSGELFELTTRAEFFGLVLRVTVALLVVLVWGSQTLARPTDRSRPVNKLEAAS